MLAVRYLLQAAATVAAIQSQACPTEPEDLQPVGLSRVRRGEGGGWGMAIANVLPEERAGGATAYYLSRSRSSATG